MTPSPTDRAAQIAATRSLALARWRVAALLTLLMVGVYFGFILLVAYRPALLGGLVSDGLSLGIVLGALVILSAWVLTLMYVQWANRVYDPALAALRAMPGADAAARGPQSAPQEGAR
jgi:uncharacterized membrane protein (DUF485 family)